MKKKSLQQPAVILTGLAALFMIFCCASPARSQDKTPQTVTVTATPSKDKKEQKVTVTAKSDAKDKSGKYNVHILKEENGKKTEIDTVISSKGCLDSEELEALMEKVQCNMKDVQDKMKEVELYIGSMNDSLMMDSSGHHKYMFRLHGSPGSPRIHIREFPHAFNYEYEMPEMPEPEFSPEEFNHEFFNQWQRSPQVLSVPKQGESLSDILGDIPMSRVKSYKVIDKKGGKRIVIDLENGPYFDHGDQVIYINGAGHKAKPQSGGRHHQDMRVIIKSGDPHGEAEQPETPAPPAEPKKSQPDSPKI